METCRNQVAPGRKQHQKHSQRNQQTNRQAYPPHYHCRMGQIIATNCTTNRVSIPHTGRPSMKSTKPQQIQTISNEFALHHRNRKPYCIHLPKIHEFDSYAFYPLSTNVRKTLHQLLPQKQGRTMCELVGQNNAFWNLLNRFAIIPIRIFL